MKAPARWAGWAPASLRGRSVLAVLALLTVLLVLLFTVVDLALGARLRADLRTRLTDRVALAQQLDSSLSSGQLVEKLRGEGVTAQLCTDGAGCITATTVPAPPSGGPAVVPSAPARAPEPPRPARPRQAASVQSSGSTLYVRTLLADGQRLTLSVDDSTVTSALSRLVALEAVAGAAMLVVAGLVLGRVVGLALRPLDQMTALARGISRGDRGRRLNTGRPDTELGRTAEAFDAMLDELETALATARDAEQRMRGFLSDASHELRTPIAGLQATVENLLRDDADRPTRERALAVMVRESARAGRLVDDLLTTTRLQDGVPLAYRDVDLAELARQEVERYRLLVPGVAWSVEGDDGVRVSADPMRIGQVLTNLLDNARHATGQAGSVVVTLRRRSADGADGGDGGDGEPGTVQLGTVELAVTDSGPGVPASERERIFERFVRLDASRSRSSGGAGLGLPIARAIALAHGGDLTAHARLDVRSGATFLLTLPAEPSPSALPSGSSSSLPSSCGPPSSPRKGHAGAHKDARGPVRLRADQRTGRMVRSPDPERSDR